MWVAGSTWKNAVAQTPVPSLPPLCAGDVSAAAGATTARGDDVTQTVTLSRPTGEPCVIAGYPELDDAAGVARSPIPVGRMSLASSATLGMHDPATFSLRYIRARGPSRVCALSVLANGAKAGGAPIAIVPCTAVSQIDVSSFTSVSEMTIATPLPAQSAAATPFALPSPCGVGDLRVRDVASEPVAGGVREIVAVQNRLLGACALDNDVHAQLFDERGRFARIPVAPIVFGSDDPRRLVLLSGHEASLTLTFATTDVDGKPCPATASIALALGTRGFTAAAPAILAPCVRRDGYGLHESPLRLGVPLSS